MFKSIILFLFVCVPLQALNMPEFDDEKFVGFEVKPPHKMAEYEFGKFSDNNPEIVKEQKESKSIVEKVEAVKEADYCRSFTFAINSNDINENGQNVLNDFKYRLKLKQKLVIIVFYQKDVEFNERENKRNAVKRSVIVQRYLTDKQVDSAQIFIQVQDTNDALKFNMVQGCIKTL